MHGRLYRAASALLAGACVAMSCWAAPAAAAVALPSGFVQTIRFSGQTTEPLTAFEVLPDGALLTAGKGGNITWVAPDDSTYRKIAQLPARNVRDIGLVGLTLAPDYATTGALFTVYPYTNPQGTGFHRVSEWRVDDPSSPTALLDERIILDGITVGPQDVHGATELVVDKDGTLWLSVGDGAIFMYVDPMALRALDVNDPHGKVLHFNRDGTGVASNPYYDAAAPSAWRSRVYASGFRSPFRFTLDPRTGGPVVADVGWNAWEEINVLRPGASYGWPCWEGAYPQDGYKSLPGCAGVGHTAPTLVYPRQDGTSVTGGVFYQGEAWPEQYRGAYMYGDYSSGRLWTVKIGTDGRISSGPIRFGSDIGGPVHFRTAPNGDVMYADIYTGNIVRLSYAPGNRKPTALVTTTTDPQTRTVAFDASRSSDLDGDTLEWTWNFGDAGSATNTATGPVVSHVYPAGDTFTATVTVTDGLGGSVVHKVLVAPGNHEPVLSVIEPTGTGPDGTFRVGDPVHLTATASDAEDGELNVTWRSALVHCRGASCHDHDPQTTVGPAYSTRFEDHGGDTRLTVRATATDSRGATATREFITQPSLRRLTVEANTPVAVTLNGVASSDALVVEGSTNSVSLPATGSDGVATFAGWADGTAGRARQVVVGPADLLLKASYATPIDRRYAADERLRQAIGEPLAPEQGSADLRWRDYQRGRMYWTPNTGARAVWGAIKDVYLGRGGHLTQGAPLNDEGTTPDGAGRYVHFANGVSIYWTSRTGAHAVQGLIRERWRSLGWEQGPLGYPVTDEVATPDGVGRYNHFSKGGSVYWSPQTGAHGIWGSIRGTWAALGWENGPLGYPVTSEAATPDGVGRYNHFSKGGSVYWAPHTGAHGVWGGIRARWASLGWERSYLGYPRSSEYPIFGGRRNDFERGFITWTASTGRITDRRY